VKIAMLSPYSLSRPGGVQGQVLGLARALRTLGHQVTVVGPDEPGETYAADRGQEYRDPDIFVMGGPTGVRSNGSIAPVTVSPIAALRAERFVRHGGFDVLHVHEPLAPIAAYGFVLHASVPMVGTYHRAGVSRWVPVPSDRPTVLFLGRHETRKGLNVLLDAFARLERPAVLWVAGDGPQSEVQRRRHPESERIKWLGTLSDTEVAARLRGADVLCAPSLRGESFGMVVLEGMAARCAVVASDLQGYRSAAGGHAVLVPPGDVGALSRALGVALADAAEGSGHSSVDALKAAEAHANGWSMESLAVRYVDAYQRAIAIFARQHS